MKKKIKEAIKKYNLIKEFNLHNDIVDRYKCNDLCENTDEAYQNGFWDEAGYLATRGKDFGNHKEWNEAIANQDIIYYAFQDLLNKELTKNK